jgi:competence ComEA-like helix-hairpin-helix protein
MIRFAVVISFFAVPLLQAQDLPEGPGKRLVQDVCTGCHGLESVTSQRATKQGWESTVDYMIQRGASMKEEDARAIVDYLAKNFGVKVNVNKATAKDIASGLELTAQEADAIVNYRKANGDFKDWDGLTKVSGVDAKKLEAKKDQVTF